MPSFQKYNLTNSYETFIYYDDIQLSGKTYYIQYMYAGYNDTVNEPDVANETFYTNLTEQNHPRAYEELIDRMEAYAENANLAVIKGFSPPCYIIDSLVSHFHKYKIM